MEAREQIEKIIAEHGAQLKRHKKHLVWQFPNGKTFIQSKSPSDTRSDLNNLAYLRSLLDLNDSERGAPGERRDKRSSSPPPKQYRNIGTMGEQLRVSGIEEESLRVKIADLENSLAQIRTRRDSWRNQAFKLVDEMNACPGCRIRGWWGRFLRSMWVPSSFRPVPQAETGEIKVPASTPREG